MLISNDALYQLLKDATAVDPKKLDAAFAESKETKASLENILLDKDLISDINLGRVESEYLGLPYVQIAKMPIPDDVLHLIPEIVAKKQQVVAFQKDAAGLHLAMANPKNLDTVEFIKKKVGLPVKVYFATDRDIKSAQGQYAKNAAAAFDEIIRDSIMEAKSAKKTEIEAPIIKIVDTIIRYAHDNRASDIHIEPLIDGSLVRYRMDGILHDIVRLPVDIHEQVVTRVKVMSRLRTDEHQAAQDGKLQVPIDEETLDLRVSIVPIVKGEKIVMRLLSEKSRRFSLADLGFSSDDLEKITSSYHKPYGMILATGPTGSGKTTTMYAILKLLNRREVNIMTIEDPVEYDLEGANQIQVNVKTGLTFAKGLRAIVRQDPNVILVGEIRDEETASIAVNSAMTGHLVLSTLHTNDAPTAIPRLLDMNIEPFLIASSVNVIVAQRLVRKICQKCRISEEIDSYKYEAKNGSAVKKDTDDKKEINLNRIIDDYFKEHKIQRVYRGKGCPVCHATGYDGRIGVYEVLVVDDELRKAILERRDAAEIGKIAVRNGMTTMLFDGLAKVKDGFTTIEEVVRVIKE